MRRIIRLCLCAIAILLPMTVSVSRAGVNLVVEDFTTTTYKDAVKTTADWNLVGGELRLFPFAPSLRGSYNTPGSAFGVAVDGDFAFVADQLNGLVVIDISDVENPSLVGMLDTTGSALGVAIVGDIAFVADSAGGLLLIDVSDPATPILMGNYDTPGFASGVVVAGDHAFVADYSGGLQVINISNPAIPTLAGSLSTPGNVNGVAVDGDHLFLADDNRGLRIVDITDPANPVSLGFFDTAGGALGVAVEGDYAFLADGGALLIFDITDPTNPSIIGSYNTPGNARSVAVSGDRVVVADDTSGLQVIDISDPTNPTLIDSYDTTGRARGVVLEGTHAIVAGGTSGLQVIEISLMLDNPEYTAEYNFSGSAGAVTVAGDYAFIGTGSGSDRFRLINIADPANPVTVRSISTSDAVVAIEVAGDLAFLATKSSLEIFDISDPANLSLVGSYSLSSTVRGMAVDGDLAIISVQSVGLEFIDISDPTTPTHLATQAAGGNLVYDLEIIGDYAFVTDWSFGLRVYDISDPANPSAVGSVSTPGNPLCLAVAGNYAFVSAGGSGLQSIDISDPTNPFIAGSVGLGDGLCGVALSGNYAFLADGSGGGLQVVDISDPASPVLRGSYDFGTNFQVAIAGDYVYLAAGFAGLRVLRVFQDEVDTLNNVGQSLTINGGTDTILRARINTTQDNDVSWELSANGVFNFEPVIPGAWVEFAVPGSELLWRSTLDWSSGADPIVSNVTVEWLNEFGGITSVTDIPNDQGRQVGVEWTRSSHDFIGDASQIEEYAVYRKIDPDLSKMPDVATARSFDELSPAARKNALMMQAAGWYFLVTVPVLVEDAYAVIVPTLADSTISAGDYQSTFRVTSLTATPGVFFHSPPDSGYSLDNLSPAVPLGITADYASTSVILDWADAPEGDFQYYRVYRDIAPAFDPSPANLVQETVVSGWTDLSSNPWNYHYKVSAVDYSGNEGGAGSIAVASDVATPSPSSVFVLRAAAPNPFNPFTVIGYSVPIAGQVRLVVYNLAGRKIRSLVDEVKDPGSYTVQWNGRDEAGKMAASGVYLYRLRAGSLVEQKRMVLLK